MKDVGEKKFINTISKIFKPLKNTIYKDDCCAVKSGNKYLLFNVDGVNDDIDFPASLGGRKIGRFAASNALSDIGSMGGTPKYVLTSFGIPKSYSFEKLIEINKSLEKVCRKNSCYIIGGDVNTNKELMIDVIAIGEVTVKNILRRKGLKVGDLLAVIGKMGNHNASYLWKIKKLKFSRKQEKDLYKKFCELMLQIKEGVILGKSKCISAMIDMSDSLYWALWEFLQVNKFGSIIFENSIPLTKNAKLVSKKLNYSKIDLLNSGGDCQLLFGVKRKKQKKLKTILKKNRLNLYIIGKVIKNRKILVERENGNIEKMKVGGFEHFKKDKLY